MDVNMEEIAADVLGPGGKNYLSGTVDESVDALEKKLSACVGEIAATISEQANILEG